MHTHNKKCYLIVRNGISSRTQRGTLVSAQPQYRCNNLWCGLKIQTDNILCTIAITTVFTCNQFLNHIHPAWQLQEWQILWNRSDQWINLSHSAGHSINNDLVAQRPVESFTVGHPDSTAHISRLVTLTHINTTELSTCSTLTVKSNNFTPKQVTQVWVLI